MSSVLSCTKKKKNTELSTTACVMCLTSCDKQDVSQSSVFYCVQPKMFFLYPLCHLHDASLRHQSLFDLHLPLSEPTDSFKSLRCRLFWIVFKSHLLTRVNLCLLQCTPPQQPMLTSPLMPVTMTKRGTHTWVTGTALTGWRTLMWCVLKFHELKSFCFNLLHIKG